jgi:kynurenine 3-monooxygenase
MAKKKESIIVLGAGLVGSLLSLFLAKRGYKVDLFEKREDLRTNPELSGRSINLALSRRGIKALKEVGVFEEVENILLPMKGRMMHDLASELTFQAYGKEDEHINSVSRGQLNQILISAAEKEGVKVHFSHKCVNIDLNKTIVDFELNGGHVRQFSGDYILGADGAYSKLRESMMKMDRFNYEQYYIPHGYKELTIPPTSDGDFALEPHALHIWPRGHYMLIALPNMDKSFTCTLFFPYEGNPSFETLTGKEEVMSFFQDKFPDATKVMPNLAEEFFVNPTSSLVTIKCFPWRKKNALLIGDASHAIVPFYGQGMNAGFEDCHVLNTLLDTHKDDWHAALEAFEVIRKPDADAISELALNNFVEMRNRVADERFLLQKKIEAKLHEQFPDKWIPLYSMVTFSDIRYSEALEIGKKQQDIMDTVMSDPAVEEIWEQLDLETIVKRL